MVRIFDKKGIMIINPDEKQMVLQRYNAISSEVFTKLINKSPAFESITYKALKDSSKELGSYTKFEKTQWSIVVRESHSYVLKTLNSIVLTIIIAILIFIIMSIYISLRFSKKIFKSFDDMEDITSRISDRNYSVKEKDMEYDEFNKLLTSFNKMQVEIDKREENLQNSLHSFKSLFNSTMESIILHENQICIDVNDVCLDFFKAKSKDEIIGKNILDLVAPEFRDTVALKYHRNSKPYEIELLKMDGTRMQGLVQGKFLNIRGRQIKVSALIDITELKNKDHLLFQQSKMASMGEMIGNIAHQWRQPLSIVSTCASGIKLEKEFGSLSDEKLHESMDMIVEHTQYLSRTIDDFRNFFKSEKNIKKFVIKDSVENALKLLSSSLKNNDIELKVDFLDEEFVYEGYPNEFIQAFINIVNNSKDAFVVNNKEDRFIEVRETLINDKYLLQIKDNAGGIPKNIKDRIFDPYFTTKHKSQGTGIGLYMTHQIIVDHMNGKVKIKNINFKKDNRTYNGSCFTIEFPRNMENDYTYMI
jgi:PAS domain S-box-containing protein